MRKGAMGVAHSGWAGPKDCELEGRTSTSKRAAREEAASHGGGASFGRSSDKCIRPAGSMRFSVNWRHEQANEMSQQELY